MEPENDLQGLLETVQKSLVEFTRTASQLSAKDVGFLRTSNPKAGRQLDRSNARLLGLSKRLLQSAVSGTSLHAPELSSTEDVEDGWRGIVDVIDNLLEKTDLALDECTGVIKRNVPEPETQPSTRPDTRQSWFKRSTLPKPQSQFQRVPNNASNAVFKPLLLEKPHAILPLDESIAPHRQSGGSEQYQHPYKAELESYKYPPFAYKETEPVPFEPIEDSEAIFVDDVEGVKSMLAELKQAKEIAIDLEHHDKHSYIGLVSLMQISTRDKDWIVDTLKPWREDLQMLNEVFADPSILKVFHGASMDIIWLQRDLGLYVVGLFDTYHASVALHYERHSLAFLLKKFASFEAQKQYQLADWRVRPLPKELHDYARSDTHFLLNIYDHMRNELVRESARQPGQENLVDAVMENSKLECLKKYEHSPYDAQQGIGQSGWYTMLIQTPALFNRPQFSVFKAVHQWRDTVGREEDENVNFILSKQSLFNIARTVPDELPKLYTCVQQVSDFVKDRIDELLQVIIKAKAAGESGPDMKTVLAEHPSTAEYEQRKAERRKFARDAHPRQPAADELPPDEHLHGLGTDVRPEAVVKKDSDFWGHAWDRSAARDLTLDLRFPIPLPPVVSETSAPSPPRAASPPPVPPQAPAEAAAPAHAPEQPSTVVLREGTRNRKRKAPAQALDLPPDETGQELADALQAVDEEGREQTREAAREARSARKALKKTRRSERMAADERAKQALADEQPFDYASAPSVLDAAKRGGAAAEGKKGARPYDKAMDAPKGMPRLKRELKGKSKTFTK